MKHDVTLHAGAGGSSPTADLYFAWSMAGEIAAGRITRLGATVFLTDRDVVVCRKGPVPRALLRGRRLIYLIDDDIRAGIRSGQVPLAYRLKLAAVEGRQMACLERRADMIVTSSPLLQSRLAARYPRKTVQCLPPAWPTPQASVATPMAGRINIALLMGLSHARNVRPVFRDLAGLLARPDVHLTVSANLDPPAALLCHPRVTVLPVLGWGDYLTALTGRRFDLMLYPMPGACAFNTARSDSKLGEAAQLGAALVVEAGWCARLGIADEGRVLQVGAEGWGQGLARLVARPDSVAATAARNRHALIREDRPARQRAFWREALALP